MDWRCGSSGRAPPLQIRSPKFKPQSHKNKTKQNTKPIKQKIQLQYHQKNCSQKVLLKPTLWDGM
jgi:hypothetical protein